MDICWNFYEGSCYCMNYFLPSLRTNIVSYRLMHLQTLCFFISICLQLKRKSARVASLEKQLQEKTSAYSQAALTNTELENQLQVQHTQTLKFFFSPLFNISYFPAGISKPLTLRAMRSWFTTPLDMGHYLYVHSGHSYVFASCCLQCHKSTVYSPFSSLF